MKKLITRDISLKTQSKKMKYNLTFERLLFLLFLTTFSLLIIVQTAMTNPSIRTFLTTDNEFEGTPMEVEEYFYDEGSIAIKLVDIETDPDMLILVNGETVAAFNENTVEISVKDGDVVEIDGSSSFNNVDAEVVSKSGNITSDCIGKTVNIKSNIKKVMDVRIE